MTDEVVEPTLVADWAGLVAHQHHGPVQPFKPTVRLSSRFSFHVDEQTLLIAPARPLRQADTDLALAYGLAHAGDRDLWLVLPEDLLTPARERLAFIETKVRVFSVGENGPTEVVPLAPSEVLAGPVVKVATDEAALGDRQRWVQVLIDWAETMPGLRAAHRHSYLAWQCDGRLVLKIKRTRHGLHVTAGVQYGKPTADQTPPTVVELTADATALDIHRAVAAASGAAAGRLDGTDLGHDEHRLQAMLTARDLGLVRMLREFPVRRDGLRPRYMDFLGVDQRGHLHIVETKIGDDPMLVLQGLDYWIWANTHLSDLAEHFGLEGEPKVFLDFVVAEPRDHSSPIGPYTAAQAEALSGEIPWRFHVVTGWAEGSAEIERHAPRAVPVDAPRVNENPRFVVRLGRHLVEYAQAHGHTLRAGLFYPDPPDGLVPAAVEALDQLREQGLDHRMVGHVRSSQAFALNLFAPLEPDARRAVVRNLGFDVIAVEPPVFEFSDPEDHLGEATTRSPHATQIDVLLRCRTSDQARHLVLIEVKLSETDFGHCSAFAAADNPRRSICHTAAPFGDDPTGCFQLTNRDGTHRRAYDTYLGQPSGQALEAGCPYRYANQPMRNVALARALIDSGEADRATVALCAHEAHTTIWRRWAAAQAVLNGVPDIYLSGISASVVLQYHLHDDADELADRYLLNGSARHRLARRAEAQHQLDAMFPLGAMYVKADPRGRVGHEHFCTKVVATDADDDHIDITAWPDPWGYNPSSWWLKRADLDQAARSGAGVLVVRTDEDGNVTTLTSDLPRIDNPDHLARVRSELPSGYSDFDMASDPHLWLRP